MAKQRIYEYQVSYKKMDGSIGSGWLVGLDDGHATEEAGYEYCGHKGDGVEVISVKKGKFLYWE